MGRRSMIGAAVVAALAMGWPCGASGEGPAPVGTVVAVTGAVQVGRDGAWQPAVAKMSLFDGQTLRSQAASGADILFEGDIPARLGAGAEIAVADLLLKAQIERTRAKIAAPGDATKTEMQVTPLTGVRGTEKAEEKSGDLKREHYWNETAPAAK